MESIRKAAQAAIDALSQLQPESQLLTDTQYREGVAARLLNDAQYDWGAINQRLFPGGDLSKVDVNAPSFAAEWNAIRHGHRARLADALLKHQRGKTFTYNELGLEIRVSASQMEQHSKETFDINPVMDIILAFGRGITEHNGTLNWPGFAPDRHSPMRTKYLADFIKERYGYNLGFTVREFSRGQRLDQRRLNGVIQTYRSVLAEDWDGLVAHAQQEWERTNRASRAAAPQVNKRPLGEFIEEKIKRGQATKDPTDALDMFHDFAVLGQRAKNANSSRKYGVEMEVTDAANIQFPQGWQRERDHSLRQQIGDGKTYDPWEFISPVLAKTYDQGMWMVCDQAAGTVAYWRAGVHVHVEGKDKRGKPMTTAQVSRLLELYTVLAPLTDPILQRGRSREFCIPTRFDQWGNGWFVAPVSGRVKPHRQQLQLGGNRAHLARDNAAKWAAVTHGPNHDAEPTEWKRHQEINLQALNKYGTIEFRAMGSVYDYEYLTRWTWLLREFMNIAQDESRSLRPFYDAVTLEEVLHLINNQAAEPMGRQRVKL